MVSYGIKMDDHLYEPDTYFAGQTPWLISVFLAQQNVKIRIGIEHQRCANHFLKFPYRVTIGISLCLIGPKMDDHLYEPETYFAGQTPGLSSVFLAQQNVKIRIGIGQQSCANHFTKGIPIGISLSLIRPKMDDHLYEPQT